MDGRVKPVKPANDAELERTLRQLEFPNPTDLGGRVKRSCYRTMGTSSARKAVTSAIFSCRSRALKGFLRYPSAPDSHETSASPLAVIMMTSVPEFIGPVLFC